MRCMASREVVVVLTGLLCYFEEFLCPSVFQINGDEETHMCPVGKGPLSHNFLRPIIHSLAKHVSSQVKGHFRG